MERFTAPWILPIAEKSLKNGSVVIDEGRIIAVGKADTLARQFPSAQEHLFPGILMPPLVNAHHHLELSQFKVEENVNNCSGMVDWIKSLLDRRGRDISTLEKASAIQQEIASQYDDGVVLLADIGNEDNICPKSMQTPLLQIYSMLEMLAPSKKVLSQTLDRLNSLATDVRATGHGPCSTPPELLKKLKSRCREYGHIFSLHTAESLDEIMFVGSGKGPYVELIQSRGGNLEMFPFGPEKEMTPASYLQELDILDEMTLLVHCVHLNEEDLVIIARSGAGICFCPGSNRYLGVGKAPVERILDHGIVAGLGTDSSASNSKTSLWREMKLLAQEHPEVTPIDILKMATIGGAAVLGFIPDFGGLVPGSRDVILHVETEKLCDCMNIYDVEQLLVKGDKPSACQLLGSPY